MLLSAEQQPHLNLEDCVAEIGDQECRASQQLLFSVACTAVLAGLAAQPLASAIITSATRQDAASWSCAPSEGCPTASEPHLSSALPWLLEACHHSGPSDSVCEAPSPPPSLHSLSVCAKDCQISFTGEELTQWLAECRRARERVQNLRHEKHPGETCTFHKMSAGSRP